MRLKRWPTALGLNSKGKIRNSGPNGTASLRFWKRPRNFLKIILSRNKKILKNLFVFPKQKREDPNFRTERNRRLAFWEEPANFFEDNLAAKQKFSENFVDSRQENN